MAGPRHYARTYNITGPHDWRPFIEDHIEIKVQKHDDHPAGPSVFYDSDSETYSEFMFVNFQPLQEPPPPSPDGNRRKPEKRYTVHGGVYAVLATGRVIELKATSLRRSFFQNVRSVSEVTSYKVVKFSEVRTDFNNTIKDKDMVDSRIQVLLRYFHFLFSSE